MQGRRREFEDCSSVLLAYDFAQAADAPIPSEIKTGRVTMPSATTGFTTTSTTRIRAPTRLESPEDAKYERLESAPASPEIVSSHALTAPIAPLELSPALPSSLSRTHFFGVYDGHSGFGAAAFTRDDLPRRLALACQKEVVSTQLLRTTLQATDTALCAALRRLNRNTNFSAGTTVIVATIDEASSKLFVANVGDSRAVLSAEGKAVFATVDHKPNLPEERDLVEKLGGRVGYTDAHSRGREKFCCAPCWVCPCFSSYKRPWRVFPGGLAVSRTFGDVPRDEAAPRVVSSDPAITEIKLEPRHDFLVLACDGVWDVISNQAVVDFISQQRNVGASAADAASALCQHAYQKGSSDNISAVVVYLKPTGKR